MNKINYDQNLDKIIQENVKNGIKPKLLLHTCCAPCASACIERVKNAFNVTLYFYNPNIDTKEEYLFRKNEAERLAKTFGVGFIFEEHNSDQFLSKVIGLENEQERGKRCDVCFSIRLEKTMQTAKEKGYEYFATSLTLSPLKNAELINKIGKSIQTENVVYLETDFKKRGGYARSIELSKQLNLYRQNYCGCKFSKRDEKDV